MKRINSILSVVVAAGFLLLGAQSAFAVPLPCDITTPTECQITGPHPATNGAFTVDRTLHIFGGGSLSTSGGAALSITITPVLPVTPPADFLMDAGALIDGNNAGGFGSAITVTLTDGDVDLATGSIIRSNGLSGGAILITTTASHTANFDGLIESVGTRSGDGSGSPGGGTITLISGCALTVSDTGKVSSRGQDPGADRVHLEGCVVTIFGLVESTAAGHVNPNNPANHCNLEPAAHPPGGDPSTFFTGCVEIWAGTTVTIDATGTHKGEVNADIGFSGGNQGRGWIDIYANGDITIKDGTGNDRNAQVPPSGPGTYLTTFAVHSNGGINQNTDDGGLITIKSLAGNVTATSDLVTLPLVGGAIQADATSAGSNGGEVHVEAFNNVTFNARLFARGDNVQTGGFGDGGLLGTAAAFTRAFNGALSWTTGVGDVTPTGTAVNPATKRGQVNLEGCTAVNLGATFPVTGAGLQENPIVAPLTCGGAPTKATAGALPGGNCLAQFCEVPASKSGTKFHDLNANHKRDVGEPGLPDWHIRIFDALNVQVGPDQITNAAGAYTFPNLSPGSYTVCEVPQVGFTQTCPQVGLDCDLVATTTASCAALVPGGGVGYAITLVAGQNETGNDFGNTQPATKSGIKWNDVNGNGVRDPGDNPLGGWPINLLTTGNAGVDSTVTAAVTGAYSFTMLPGTYRVCEGVGPAGFTQTFPNALTPNPPGETIINTCPGPNVWGYEFTVVSAQALTNDDFGNFRPPVNCPEDPNAVLTKTVSNPASGFDYPTLQAAYNAAVNGDVIGMFGKTIENVTLGGAKTLKITQCTSARITAADNSLPVWNITSTGRLTIVGPDSVGGTIGWLIANASGGPHILKSVRANGASIWGIRINSNKNEVSWNDVSGNGGPGGILVAGSFNILKGGTTGPNNGDGVKITGDSNSLSGATVNSNTGNGVIVTGGSNQIKGNSAGLNTLDGFNNAGGLNNKYSGNSSNKGGQENGGAEYRFVTTGLNGGSNRADGVNVPSAAKGCTSFNAGQVCE